jgi:hypothetical protein
MVGWRTLDADRGGNILQLHWPGLQRSGDVVEHRLTDRDVTDREVPDRQSTDRAGAYCDLVKLDLCIGRGERSSFVERWSMGTLDA